MIASQRARLQRAIIEIAAKDGLGAITVRKLTKLAGVSSGTFYSRFSGIDDCLLTTYEEIMASTACLIVDTRSSDLGLTEQLDRALRALLGRLLADRDVARFVLIEIYGGGPAAIRAIGTEERRLESALRGCVDRRGRRISKTSVSAIYAAVLHCARVALIDASPDEAAQMTDALIDWASDVIEDKEEFGIPTAASLPLPLPDSTRDPARPTLSSRDEEDLILAAILRLSLPDGFRGLDSSKVSSAAGLPAARFRRYFASLADGYLTAIRRTCGSFFVELTTRANLDSPTRASIRAALHSAVSRAASDPTAAHLTFRQIVEPGVAGLTCREALISELAIACGEEPASDASAVRVRAEARIAALWEALARGAQAQTRMSMG